MRRIHVRAWSKQKWLWKHERWGVQGEPVWMSSAGVGLQVVTEWAAHWHSPSSQSSWHQGPGLQGYIPWAMGVQQGRCSEGAGLVLGEGFWPLQRGRVETEWSSEQTDLSPGGLKFFSPTLLSFPLFSSALQKWSYHDQAEEKIQSDSILHVFKSYCILKMQKKDFLKIWFKNLYLKGYKHVHMVRIGTCKCKA